MAMALSTSLLVGVQALCSGIAIPIELKQLLPRVDIGQLMEK
jgi:hypothetical protein